jgi:hypothetical protein
LTAQRPGPLGLQIRRVLVVEQIRGVEQQARAPGQVQLAGGVIPVIGRGGHIQPLDGDDIADLVLAGVIEAVRRPRLGRGDQRRRLAEVQLQRGAQALDGPVAFVRVETIGEHRRQLPE